MIGFASHALLPGGWADDVRIVLGADGRFERVEPGAAADGASWRCDIAIPGIPNLHSHAFQRGMAGLAEARGAPDDSFWSWRQAMYRLALRVTPEQMQAIATQLYVEMLRAGYTQVAEFHYLHNDLDGTPYADPAELAQRLAQAARDAGIGLTMLPTLYAQGGFDAAPLEPQQRRFRSSPDSIGRIVQSLAAQADGSMLRVGIALHSLRAAPLEAMRETVAAHPEVPVHVHVAEQQAELEACLTSTGRRPVTLLLDEMPVDRRWCLIHATHVDAAEVARIAATGAVVGLCPITEANLGDGIFPLPELLAGRGRYGIGSDSNILASPGEELRLLEYGQRLDRKRRCLAIAPGTAGSIGRSLFDAAGKGGAAACGLEAHGIRPGARADLCVLEPDALALPDATGDRILDSALFACGRLPVRDVMCGGVFRIRDSHHPDEAAIAARFQAAIRALHAS